MTDSRVVDYIKKAREAGQRDADIKLALLQNGWSEQEVNENLLAVGLEGKSFDAGPSQQKTMSAQAGPEQKTMPARKKSPVLLVFFIILIGLVLAGGGLAYVLYSRIWDPLWNPFRPDPETVILKAWENLKTVESENFVTQITISGKNITANDTNFNFNFSSDLSGGADMSDPNNKLADVNIDVTASADVKENQITVGGKVEVRLIGDTAYIKIDDLTLGPLEFFAAAAGIDKSQIQGKWIKLDESAAGAIATQYSGAQENIGADQEKNLQELADKITKTLIEKKVYDIKELTDKKTSEGPQYHYSVSLNKDRFIAVFPDLFDMLSEYAQENGALAPEAGDMEKARTEMSNFLNKLGAVSIDLFIGKTDNLLRRVTADKDFEISKFNDVASGTVSVKVNMEHSNINKPLQVSAPENYVSLEDFLLPYRDTAYAKTAAIKSGMNGILFSAKMIKSSEQSYASLCYKGLLNGYQKEYGKSLINFNNDIIAIGGSKPNCFANASSFCVSSQLSDGTWYCVGKDNTFGTMKCLSADTICR